MVMLAELRESGEAATDDRVKDVIGYRQKSAEVIVGRKRRAEDASIGGSLTNPKD